MSFAQTFFALIAHLGSVLFHSPYKSEVETGAKAVLEEDWGTAAEEATLRDDSHSVTQQVGLVHVVGGHYHCASCKPGTERIPVFNLLILDKNSSLFFYPCMHCW